MRIPLPEDQELQPTEEDWSRSEGSAHPLLSELYPEHPGMFDCCRNMSQGNALQYQSSQHCSTSHQPGNQISNY